MCFYVYFLPDIYAYKSKDMQTQVSEQLHEVAPVSITLHQSCPL